VRQINHFKYYLLLSNLAIKISNITPKFNNNIQFIWIPDHCVVYENEKADKVYQEIVNNPTMEIFTNHHVFKLI